MRITTFEKFEQNSDWIMINDNNAFSSINTTANRTNYIHINQKVQMKNNINLSIFENIYRLKYNS